MTEKHIAVTVEADIKNTFYPNPPMFNVVGEIAGTDKADEVVMLGGHFDSWHASTGATDNGAGAGAMMEASILKMSGVKMRAPCDRTVAREEQGLNGSAEHRDALRRRPPPPPPPGTPQDAAAPVRPRLLDEPAAEAGAREVRRYFNIDNGTGAIRGVYLQQNDAARRSSASGWSRSAAWA